MPLRRLFLALVPCLFLTSCLDVHEKIRLEKNGSGKYELELNFQSLKNLATFLRVADLVGKGPQVDLEKMPQFDRELRLSELPDSVKKRLPHGDLLSKIEAEIHMNAQKRQFRAEFELKFDRPEEVEKFYEILETVAQRSQKTFDLEAAAGALLLKNRPSFTLENGVFSRKAGSAKGATGVLSKIFSHTEQFERLFGRADYRLTYRMPSRVKSISNTGYRKGCKKIRRTVPMAELARADMNFSATLKSKK